MLDWYGEEGKPGECPTCRKICYNPLRVGRKRYYKCPNCGDFEIQ